MHGRRDAYLYIQAVGPFVTLFEQARGICNTAQAREVSPEGAKEEERDTAF